MKAVFDSVDTADGEIFLVIEEGNTKISKIDSETFIKEVLNKNFINASIEGLQVRIKTTVLDEDLYDTSVKQLIDRVVLLDAIAKAFSIWGYDDQRLINLETQHPFMESVCSLMQELQNEWDNRSMWHIASLSTYIGEEDIAEAPNYNICCRIDIFKYSEDSSTPALTLWFGETEERQVFIQANSPSNEEPEWVLTGQISNICNEAFTKIKETLGYKIV